MSKLFKLIVVSLFFGLVVYYSNRMWLNYSGYCTVTERYLSDSEKIEIAIKYVIRLYPPVVDIYEKNNSDMTKVGRSWPDNIILYNSIDEFINVNENCCEITVDGYKGHKRPLKNSLYGSLASYIRVKYKVRYFDSDGDNVSTMQEDYVAITNCGVPWSGI